MKSHAPNHTKNISLLKYIASESQNLGAPMHRQNISLLKYIASPYEISRA